jgi:hypothetical protein
MASKALSKRPGELPPPHPELPLQSPLLFTLRKGETLVRHHLLGLDPIFFGTTGSNRFDDPSCNYGVLYAAADAHGAFIESCSISASAPAVTGTYLDQRALAHLELTEDLVFIDLFETGGLRRIGADSRLFAGEHAVAQLWSAALRGHPSKPAGIRYPARHDHMRAAYGIFSRSPSSFKVSSIGSLMLPSNRALLNDILATYDVALV